MRILNREKRIASIFLALMLIFAVSYHGKDELFLSSGYSVKIIEGNKKKALALASDLDAFEKKIKLEVEKINNAKADVEIVLDDEILHLFSIANDLFKQTDGLLNCAIYPALRLWGFDGGSPHIPSDEELAAVMQFCNMEHFTLDFENKTLRKKYDQNQIDFGAIAKGYICGRLTLKAQVFVKSGILDLLGNLAIIGENTAANRDFLIGIKHPRAFETGEAYSSVLGLKNCYASTSSDAERFFEKDGVRYSHILDGRTGKQADTDLLSATAISPDLSPKNATLTDAYSTIFYLLGSEKASEFASKTGFRFVGV